MKKQKIDFNRIETIEDLESLNIGRIKYDISHRGGYLGFSASDVAEFFGVDENNLPTSFGVFVNYLGGGLRGSILKSDIYKLKESEQKKVFPLLEALYRIYENTENEIGLNDFEDEDGETNWEAVGTASCRKNKVASAY